MTLSEHTLSFTTCHCPNWWATSFKFKYFTPNPLYFSPEVVLLLCNWWRLKNNWLWVQSFTHGVWFCQHSLHQQPVLNIQFCEAQSHACILAQLISKSIFVIFGLICYTSVYLPSIPESHWLEPGLKHRASYINETAVVTYCNNILYLLLVAVTPSSPPTWIKIIFQYCFIYLFVFKLIILIFACLDFFHSSLVKKTWYLGDHQIVQKLQPLSSTCHTTLGRISHSNKGDFQPPLRWLGVLIMHLKMTSR